MRRIKSPDFTDRNIFGVPLLHVLQTTGLPLPQSILYAMRFLRRTSSDAVGIFRKPGVRSRILQLKRLNESNPGKGPCFLLQLPHSFPGFVFSKWFAIPHIVINIYSFTLTVSFEFHYMKNFCSFQFLSNVFIHFTLSLPNKLNAFDYDIVLLCV